MSNGKDSRNSSSSEPPVTCAAADSGPRARRIERVRTSLPLLCSSFSFYLAIVVTIMFPVNPAILTGSIYVFLYD